MSFFADSLIARRVDAVYADSELTYIMLDDGTQVTIRGPIVIEANSKSVRRKGAHRTKTSHYNRRSEPPLTLREATQFATQGDPVAQFSLATAYAKGDGVEADAAKAKQWLLQSAENGFAPAQYNVGCYLRDGMGEHAFDWFMKSARQNFGPAQFDLGVLYSRANHHSLAFVWFSLAAWNGIDGAEASRKEAASLLSKTALDAARLQLFAETMALEQW